MSQFVCFQMAEYNDDVTLENESSEGENMSDTDVDFIDDTEYNESVENYYMFENFLESMMMQLEILLLDLIFHKSQATIVLMMRSVMK